MRKLTLVLLASLALAPAACSKEEPAQGGTGAPKGPVTTVMPDLSKADAKFTEFCTEYAKAANAFKVWVAEPDNPQMQSDAKAKYKTLPALAPAGIKADIETVNGLIGKSQNPAEALFASESKVASDNINTFVLDNCKYDAVELVQS